MRTAQSGMPRRIDSTHCRSKADSAVVRRFAGRGIWAEGIGRGIRAKKRNGPKKDVRKKRCRVTPTVPDTFSTGHLFKSSRNTQANRLLPHRACPGESNVLGRLRVCNRPGQSPAEIPELGVSPIQALSSPTLNNASTSRSKSRTDRAQEAKLSESPQWGH